MTLGGIFYGGISEEIMMRWGLMSFVAWMGWRFFQHGKNRAKPWIMWLSILISSLLFGVAHLGANTVLAPLTWFIFFRMMLLNGIAGIVFGCFLEEEFGSGHDSSRNGSYCNHYDGMVKSNGLTGSSTKILQFHPNRFCFSTIEAYC